MEPWTERCRPRWGGLLPWLVAALAVQAAIVIARDGAVVNLPPVGTAQGILLQDIYGLSARWSPAGWSGLWRELGTGGDRPTVATLAASLVQVYGGTGRLSLLLPGLVLLLASEIAFAAALLRLTRSAGLAALGVGLLLLRTRPWLAGTGLFTVNTDWLASCLFGLAVSILIAPPALRRLPLLLVGTVLGLATLCLSSTVFACLLAVTALRLAIGRRVTFAKVAAAAVLAAAAAALFLTTPRCPAVPATGISLGQGTAAQCGQHLWASMLSLASFGLGPKVLLAAALSLGTAAVWIARHRADGAAPGLGRRTGSEALFLTATLAALALVQVMRRGIDPIGSGLVDVPLTAWFVLGLAALVDGRWRGHRGPARLACFGFLALSGMLGLGYPLLDALPTDPERRAAEAEAATWLVQDAESQARPRARVLTSASLPLLDGPGLSAFFFESFGEVAAFTVAKPAEYSVDVGEFDYAILPGEVLAGQAGADLLRRLDAAMVRRARLDPQGLDLVVFSAPDVAVSGISGEWLLAAGTSLRFAVDEMPAGSVVALRGPYGDNRYIPVPPTVTALATLRDGTTLSLPARFVREGEGYAIFVDPAPLVASSERRAEVALTFDRFFVPKEVGLNPDPRRLVAKEPTAIGLAPRATAFDAARSSP